MKRRICNINHPVPTIACTEEMQNAKLHEDEVVIEFITDAQGNKIK